MQVRSEQALRLSVERLESLHRELGKAEMRVMRKIKISQILEFPYIFRSGSKTGTRFKAQCYETRNSAKELVRVLNAQAKERWRVCKFWIHPISSGKQVRRRQFLRSNCWRLESLQTE